MKRLISLLTPLVLLGATADAQLFNIGSTLKAPETVFDNSHNPWVFTNPVPAISFDNGGSGIAYNSISQNPNCTANGSGYRADYIVSNFKNSTLSPPNASIPFQICTVVGDWYQFTISTQTAGPYNMTLYTVNQFAGAVWNISIDGTVVSSITTPGSGGFTTVLPATSASFNMTQGNHILRFTALSGDATNGLSGDFVQWQGGSVASIACDTGPSAPAIPVLAQTAGFTHCVINADFTQVGGYFGTLSNFVDACGGPTGDPNGWNGFVWFDWKHNPAPCDSNHIEITADPLGSGLNVLHIKYPLADQTAYLACGANVNTCPKWTYLLGYPQQGTRLPYEEYIQTTALIPSTSFQTNGKDDLVWIYWLFSTQNGGGPGLDQFEIHVLPTNGFYQNGPGGCSAPCNQTLIGASDSGTANWSTYQVTGLLNTSDETSTIDACTYLNPTPSNDGFHHCYQTNNFANPPAVFGQHNNWIFQEVGGADCFGQGNAGCLTHDQDIYVKNFQIWACANYRTQTCPGPLITSDNAKPKHYAQDDLTPQELIKRAVAWLEDRVLTLVSPAHAAEK